MTRELLMTSCIRGCTTACHQTDCEHDHPAIPRPFTVGFLCGPCADRLWEALADIELLYPDLDLYATTRDAQVDTHRGKISGSPALIRVDVMAMLDFESRVGDGVRSVVGTLYDWCRCLHDELGVTLPDTTLSGVLGILRPWHEKICAQSWVDEYWSEVIELRAMLRRATNAPPPVGRCFGRIANHPCGRLLYPDMSGDIICPDPTCGRQYTGADLLRLQIQGEREGIA